MENSFFKVMAVRSDADLQAIAMQRDRYQPEAVIAAIEELERRNLSTPELVREKQNVLDQLREDERQAAQHTQQFKQERTQARNETLFLLRPNRHYFYTPVILYINIAIWLLMIATGVDAFQPSVEHLINWGGNLRGLTLSGEYWRLFSSTFVHGGIIHLALNMYALLQVGAILEIKFGNHRFFLCYVATGILASIASIAFHDNIVSVGASGSIFGLFGLFFSLLLTKSIDIPQEARKNLISSTAIFILYNLVFGFAVKGIDNAAHIGGLVSGFVLGAVYFPAVRKPRLSNIISVVIVVLLIIAIVAASRAIPNTLGQYETVINTFARNEEKTMWVNEGSLPSRNSYDIAVFKDRLQREGIFLWKENLALLNSLEDLPEDLQQEIDKRKVYCELRIKYCETLMAMVVVGKEEENIPRMDSIVTAINEILSKGGQQ